MFRACLEFISPSIHSYPHSYLTTHLFRTQHLPTALTCVQQRNHATPSIPRDLSTEVYPSPTSSTRTSHPSQHTKALPTGPNPTNSTAQIEQTRMCQVQRVLNTCGHKNDHVLLTCHLARRVLPQPEPSASYPSSQRRQEASQHEHEDEHQDQGQGQGLGHRSGSDTNSPPPPAQQTAILSITGVEIAIASTGFQACSQPYCIFARIRELTSPVGFMCMVEGCGRAD